MFNKTLNTGKLYARLLTWTRLVLFIAMTTVTVKTAIEKEKNYSTEYNEGIPANTTVNDKQSAIFRRSLVVMLVGLVSLNWSQCVLPTQCAAVFANSQNVSSRGQFGNLGGLPFAGSGMGNGGLGMGVGLGVMGMSPQEYAVLNNAVKTIIGPHANPDMALLTYATQQGGIPRNMFQMLGYIPFLQNIARSVGLQPTSRSGVGQTIGQIGTSVTGGQNIDNTVMQRAIQWMTQSGLMASPMMSMFR